MRVSYYCFYHRFSFWSQSRSHVFGQIWHWRAAAATLYTTCQEPEKKPQRSGRKLLTGESTTWSITPGASSMPLLSAMEQVLVAKSFYWVCYVSQNAFCTQMSQIEPNVFCATAGLLQRCSGILRQAFQTTTCLSMRDGKWQSLPQLVRIPCQVQMLMLGHFMQHMGKPNRIDQDEAFDDKHKITRLVTRISD